MNNIVLIPLRSRGITAKERLFGWEKCSFVKLTAAIVPTEMKILTMAIKKQLQNVAFELILLNKNYFKSFSSFTLLWVCGADLQNNTKILRL